MKILGRGLSKGVSSGPLLITKDMISFFGGVDPKTGIIIDRWHPMYGKVLKGNVLALPRSKGSTVGSYVIYSLSKYCVAPSAMIIRDHDTLIGSGCIIARIPLVRLKHSDWELLAQYNSAIVNGYEGYVEVD